MTRLLLLMLLLVPRLGATPGEGPNQAPDVCVRIEYAQRVITPDGMTKVTQFQERLVRTRDHVWQERILPPSNPAAGDHDHASHEDGGHLHPKDLGTAARHVSRDAQGRVRLEFAHPVERLVIAAETRDYPEVGFDGSWAVACHLVDPAMLLTLTRVPAKSTEGRVCYERVGEKQFLRIWWNERLQLPSRIESGSLDGTRLNETVVQPLPLPSPLPWQALDGWRRRDYVDLLD